MWHKFKKSARICLVLLAVCLLAPISPHQIFAQSKSTGAGKSPLCTRDNALDIVKQQIDLTKTFSNSVPRITVLIRAADLLWPHQQDRARAVFTEAFELATEQEKENDEKGPRSVILRMQYPDQRYVVIRAIAKRDSRWAKELTRRMLRQGDASPSRDSFSDLLTAERLLESASKLISTDINAAVDLARASFSYPATAGLTRFLYALARVNLRTADEFYYLALANYGSKPIREFLYLQAYPFGLPNSLNTPVFAFYEAPPNLGTTELSLYLRRVFVVNIVQRAQRALEEPLAESDTYPDPSGVVTPPKVNLLRSLMELEPHIKGPLVDLLPAVIHTRERLLVSLSVEIQKQFLQPGREVSTAPKKNFDEEIESALKTPDVNRRDNLIATVVLSDIAYGQRVERLIEVIDKVSDSNLRASLLDKIYFARTTVLIDARFEGAEKLASKVEGHEQRAYLRIEIAKALLNDFATQTYASEALDQAIYDAKKAGPTIFAARTLLTASSLYTKIDLGRAISVLGDAINLVNRLEGPDFVSDDQALVKRVQRPGERGQHVFRYYMPGLDPQSVIGVMAKIDFDTALSQTSALTDRPQRALSMLALAEVCLQQAPPPAKQKPKAS